MLRAWLLLLLPACQVVFPFDPPPPIDAPPDAPPDAALPLCYGRDLVQICLDAPPLDHFNVENDVLEIDTDTSPSCVGYTLMAGENPTACVIAAANIKVSSTLRGRGVRTLVLIASNRLDVFGIVDVATTEGSNGAGGNPSGECTVGQVATARAGGGGGSFGGKGGNGGVGATGGTTGKAGPVAIPTRLRGGCKGGGGFGSLESSGEGGGAVALIATTIAVTGTINASGQGAHGGVQAAGGGGGGGGGGSGGMILLDGVVILDPVGQVFANGGGGGAGAGTGMTAHGCDAPDPTSYDAAPQGEDGGTVPALCGAQSGGHGGIGSSNGVLDGANGQSAPTPLQGGGGGAGGGGGVIRVFPATQMLGLRVSPPPS